MAKAIVLNYLDADPGVDDNNIVLLAEVLFVGATVPNGPLIDRGPNGNGVAIPYNITGTASAFSNSVETSLSARATQLGFSIGNTDVLFPAYNRGT